MLHGRVDLKSQKAINLSSNTDEQAGQGTEDAYTSEYEVGQDNIEAFGLDIHNPVFILSGSVTVIFVILTLLFPQVAAESFGSQDMAHHYSGLVFYLQHEFLFAFLPRIGTVTARQYSHWRARRRGAV